MKPSSLTQIGGERCQHRGEWRQRVLQAALLRKCCHEPKDQIDRRGLRLKNAVVAGCLNLAGLAVPFPLRYDGYEFDSALVVEGAEP